MPSLGITTQDKGIKQIFLVNGVILPSINQLLRQSAEIVDISPVLRIFTGRKTVKKGRTPRPVTRARQKTGHSLDERMHLVMVKRVEARAHGTESDSVECQAGEIVRDGDGHSRALTRPFHDELASNVVHI